MIFCLFLQVDVDIYNEYLPYFFPKIDKMESTKPEGEDDKSISAEAKDSVEPSKMEDDVNSVNSQQDEKSTNLEKEENSAKTEVGGTGDGTRDGPGDGTGDGKGDGTGNEKGDGTEDGTGDGTGSKLTNPLLQ